MTSRTGNKAGFSLMELMIAVSFVTLGSLVIQGSFVRAADMFGRYTHTLQIQRWMHEGTASLRHTLLYSEDAAEAGSGTIVLDSKSYNWSREVDEKSDRFYAIQSKATWTEGGRTLELNSEEYAFKKDLPQR